MSLTIYKASAGSGKTFTLAATFIAHLISDEAPSPHRHQLAVTFTNKATAEMKERILQHLYDLAHSTDDHDGFFLAVRRLVPSHITDRMIRQLSARTLLNIIHDYDHFHVTTIDSFFQSLLANLAHELNLAASFKVEISDKEVIAKALTQMIDKTDPHSEQMQWIKAYIRERMSNDKAWSIESELKELAQQILKEDYMLYSHLLHQGEKGGFELDTQTVANYKQQLNELVKTLRTDLTAKARSLDDFIRDTLDYSRISYGTSRYLPFISKLADGRIHLREITPPNSTILHAAEDALSMLKSADKKKQECVEMAAEIQIGLRSLLSSYQEARFLTNSCTLSLGNLNPLCLLDAIRKEIEAINQENNRILLANTPLLFHHLANNSDSSFIFERAGTQYHHVMIDEFQDTSKLQWSNMRHLLVENMSQGNTCMLVGDVKQGIYRFRGGDWNALANFQPGYSPDLNADIAIETLKTNFRSGIHIVDFNNRLFVTAAQVIQDTLSEIWNEDDNASHHDGRDIQLIYPTPDTESDNHEVTQMAHNEGGFVRLQLTDSKPPKDKDATPTEEAGQQAEAADFSVEASLAEQMLRLHAAGVPFKDMAILIRWNTQAKTLLDYFDLHHGQGSTTPIPLVSEEAFLLSASPAVQVIIHALRYVADPTHGIALEYIRSRCPAERWEDVYSLLCEWHQESYGGLPFYEVSCRLIDLFNLHAMEGQSPYIYTFLDALLAYIDENAADIRLFLDHWDETLNKKAIPSTAIDGVRILTIHKSKGLAFHSVFLPYCDWKINDKPDILWVKPTSAPFDTLPLLPVKMTKEADDSIYREAYRQELFDAYVENLNTIYVAFTRARQNLLVWCDTHTTGIATIIQGAAQSIGADGQIVEKSATTTVYEFGSPSSLECPHPDNLQPAPMDESENTASEGTVTSPADDADKPQGNPLIYDATTICLNFTHYSPRLVFQQSNNALQFFSIDSEAEEDAPADAPAANGEAAATASATQDAALQEEYRQRGIILHLLMSSIESTKDIDARIDDFARQGIIPPAMNIGSLKRLIRSRISHPTAAAWFDGSWRLYRESAIIYREEGKTVTRRPDRVMMRGNRSEGTDETVVIDFKFGRYKPEHRQQVEQYIDLLHRQGISHVKGYLWYLYSGSIEEVL